MPPYASSCIMTEALLVAGCCPKRLGASEIVLAFGGKVG